MKFLIDTFPQKYQNIVYVSANPFVNSGMEVRHKEKYTFCNYLSYDARKHFYRVVDVWKDGWKNGTVHPLEVNKAFHRAYLRYKGKRFVLHYLQPHQPFLDFAKDNRKHIPGLGYVEEVDDLKDNAYKVIPIWKHLSPPLRWKIKQLFGIPSSDVLESHVREDKDALEMFHKHDILVVMEYVEMLQDHIKGRWLVTSDHGDRLYNFLRYEHGGPRDKEVIEVPWLEVET